MKKSRAPRGGKFEYRLFAVIVLLVATLTVSSVWSFSFHYYGTAMYASAFFRAQKADNFAKLAGEAEKGRVVFFGDSLTEMYDTEAFYPGHAVHNRGISGDTSEEMLARLDTNLLTLEPSAIVFLGGTNDFVHGGDVESICANLREILTRIRAALPDTPLIVQSLYPVNPDIRLLGLSLYNPSRNNAALIAVNDRLREECAQTGATYVDIHALLLEDGKLAPAYTFDGLHVNRRAYGVITAAIAPYLSGLERDANERLAAVAAKNENYALNEASAQSARNRQ